MPQHKAFLVARAPLQGAILARASAGVLASLARPAEWRHLRHLDHSDLLDFQYQIYLKTDSLIFATLKPTFEGVLLKKFTGRQ